MSINEQQGSLPTHEDAPSFVDIEALASEGTKLLREEKRDVEDAKLGTLRGGTSGILLDDGETVTGNCLRKALARSEGIDVDPAEEDRDLMFQAGFSNEDIWYKELAGPWEKSGGKILREEECMISWKTENGKDVTGRPDMVLCSPTENERTFLTWNDEKNEIEEKKLFLEPKQVVEFKLVSSLWTARSVLFEKKPKLVHLAQLGHYMLKLGEQFSQGPLPGHLTYTNRANLTGPSWGTNLFPAWGEPLSEHIEYTIQRMIPDGVYKTGKNKGKPKFTYKKLDIYKEHVGLSPVEISRIYKIPVKELHGEFKNVKPFRLVYLVRFAEDGTLEYTRAGTVLSWERTILTKDNITSFYERVATMKDRDDLGPRPENLEANGDLGGYDPCTYCKARRSCESHEHEHGTGNVKAWLDRVRATQEEDGEI